MLLNARIVNWPKLPLHPQANVEPLLLLSHKYDFKVPLQLCMTFLSESDIKPSKYTSLPTEQLARLPAWLAIARRLQLTDLYNTIMACLEDSITKLNVPGKIAYPPRCGHCKARYSGYSGYSGSLSILNSAGVCPICQQYDAAAMQGASGLVFQRIWGVSFSRSSDTALLKQRLVAAVQQRLSTEEALGLLMVLMARDCKASVKY